VKAHAAATSGMLPFQLLFWERRTDVLKIFGVNCQFSTTPPLRARWHSEDNRTEDGLLTICSATVPCLIIAGVNAYVLWNEHWEHWAHKGPLEERTEYDYQNLRTKNYFWGDGDKVCLPCIDSSKTLQPDLC
jgi:hypothetical protein